MIEGINLNLTVSAISPDEGKQFLTGIVVSDGEITD